MFILHVYLILNYAYTCIRTTQETGNYNVPYSHRNVNIMMGAYK